MADSGGRTHGGAQTEGVVVAMDHGPTDRGGVWGLVHDTDYSAVSTERNTLL
jgi:hypothetical protein